VPPGGAPDVDPVSWVRPPLPEDVRLRAENRLLREQVDKLTNQLEALQSANEGWYRLDHERTGGSRFDRKQTFPSHPNSPGPTTKWFAKDDA
jgi:hypothetical protein